MGNVWGTDSEGGYMYSDQLSAVLRQALQPMTRFRQFCDAEDATVGYSSGNTFRWNIYSDLATQGGELTEGVKMPETSGTIAQASLTITEYGKLLAACFVDFMDDSCAKVIGFPMTAGA